LKKILLLAFVLLLFPCFSLAMSKKEIVSYFQGNQEKAAKDAAWTSDKIFKVAVYNDGTSKNGYAQYVCAVLSEHNLSKGVWVQIIDVAKLNIAGKWVKLGEQRCK
jgi:hypothetical protein